MSTAQEIENAIRSLPPAEREKLLKHLPRLFPEFAGDSEWERIAQDERPRPELTDLLNRYETDLAENPEKFPRVAEAFPCHPENISLLQILRTSHPK